MPIARDFKKTIISRVQREPEFAQALLNEAVLLCLNGELETAKLILSNFVKANKL